MLVLNRKQGESIRLDDDIEITILEIQDGRVKLGIDAPSHVTILRNEIYIEVMEENKKSTHIDGRNDLLDMLKILKK